MIETQNNYSAFGVHTLQWCLQTKFSANEIKCNSFHPVVSPWLQRKRFKNYFVLHSFHSMSELK